MPENLAIGLMIARQREKCSSIGCDFDYYGFAFGQSPFHVLPLLSGALKEAAENSGYADAEGIFELRQAAAGFNARYFGLPDEPDRIVIGPGTKGLFFLLLSIISGDLIIPAPAWIGYSPQARFLGKRYHPLKTSWNNQLKVTADELEKLQQKIGGGQHILVLNSPNNPTGQVYSRDELKAIARVCRKYGIIVLADEIYALTTFKFSTFTSMGTVYPEGTFVLNGLSKDRSAGGYRLGVCQLPEADQRKTRDGLQKLAATVYTNITTPVQQAAVAAYSENESIDKYFSITRIIHEMMGLYISDLVASIKGLRVTKPAGGFYFYVDFNDIRDILIERGVTESNSLSEALLSHPHHIATVTGDALELSPNDFGARIAYVDYDGHRVYDSFLDQTPETKAEKDAFVEQHAQRMIQGAGALEKFIHNRHVKAGKSKAGRYHHDR